MENNILNKKKPDISIVASAHRPQNWMKLYKSIGDNRVVFEMVFVGPNQADYQLPENFRFIHSLVKPTQCLEIAFRNANADLVMNIADDCEFVTASPLDKLYNLYQESNSGKVIISSRMMTNGQDQSGFAHRFFTDNESSPVMPLSGLMSKDAYRKLGGIDKNFIAIMWDLDLAMRIYALGGKVILSDVYLNESRSKSMTDSLCSEFWKHDRGLFESLWTINSKVCLSRKRPVEPFSDINILNASQGPRGRWQGSSPVILEQSADRIKQCGLILKRIARGVMKPKMYFNYVKRVFCHIIEDK